MIEVIEKTLKEKEPKAKDIAYATDKDNNIIVKFRIGNKKHEININNSMYNLSIAWPDKELAKLREEYEAMREEFDELIKEATKHISVQYKKQFEDIRTKSEELKEKIDKITEEFLEAKISNYFSN